MTDQTHIEDFRATALGSGWPTRVDISDTEWAFQVDEPKEDGGSNSGPNPMHHFVASLAGCQNEQAQVVAEEMGIDAGKVQIKLEVSLNLAGFMGMAQDSEGCFERVRISASVAGVSEEQARVLGSQVDARCPVLSLLRTAGTTIESSWAAS